MLAVQPSVVGTCKVKRHPRVSQTASIVRPTTRAAKGWLTYSKLSIEVGKSIQARQDMRSSLSLRFITQKKKGCFVCRQQVGPSEHPHFQPTIPVSISGAGNRKSTRRPPSLAADEVLLEYVVQSHIKKDPLAVLELKVARLKYPLGLSRENGALYFQYDIPTRPILLCRLREVPPNIKDTPNMSAVISVSARAIGVSASIGDKITRESGLPS